MEWKRSCSLKSLPLHEELQAPELHPIRPPGGQGIAEPGAALRLLVDSRHGNNLSSLGRIEILVAWGLKAVFCLSDGPAENPQEVLGAALQAPARSYNLRFFGGAAGTQPLQPLAPSSVFGVTHTSVSPISLIQNRDFCSDRSARRSLAMSGMYNHNIHPPFSALPGAQPGQCRASQISAAPSF